MWNSSLDSPISVCPPQQLARPLPAIPPLRPAVRKVTTSMDESRIGKGLILKGEISGTEPLFLDGSVQGSINLPGSLVTVGANGQVTASIAARDVLVLGKVFGNIVASNRLDIRAEGSVTGDVIAARMSIEDGAYVKGRVSLDKTAAEPVVTMDPVSDAVQAPQTRLLAPPEGGQRRMQPVAQPA
jgi:cytoskeletal protein CcmA (bactofilin family)